MAYSTTELLALPNKEKRALANKLWKSLPENKSITTEDKKLIAIATQKWEDIKSGKAVLLTQTQFRKKIDALKNKRNKIA